MTHSEGDEPFRRVVVTLKNKCLIDMRKDRPGYHNRAFSFMTIESARSVLPIVRRFIMYKETIAAVATALAQSGISIIRISGDQAVAVADRILEQRIKRRILEHAESHTIHYGFYL